MRTLCTLFTTFALLAPAFAEDAPKPDKEKPAPSPMANFRAAMAHADTDKDGAISPTELGAITAADLKERFTSFDADGDGALSATELEAAKKGWRPAKEGGKEKKPKPEGKADAQPEEAPAPAP